MTVAHLMRRRASCNYRCFLSRVLKQQQQQQQKVHCRATRQVSLSLIDRSHPYLPLPLVSSPSHTCHHHHHHEALTFHRCFVSSTDENDYHNQQLQEEGKQERKKKIEADDIEDDDEERNDEDTANYYSDDDDDEEEGYIYYENDKYDEKTTSPQPNILKELEIQRQQKYEAWKLRRGHKPNDVLLDELGEEVLSPDIPPDFRITSKEPLPPEWQQAVDQHVYWSCYHEHTIPRKRNPLRHFRLDSRESLQASKKKALRKELAVTPFLMIGAYQNLLRRAQQYPYDLPGSRSGPQGLNNTEMIDNENDAKKDKDLAGHNIRNASIPFSWFQTTARSMCQAYCPYSVHKHKVLPLPKDSYKANTDVETLIFKETMSMLMRPIIAPLLPSNAWYHTYFNHCYRTKQDNADCNGDKSWKFVQGTEKVQAVARDMTNSSIMGRHSLMLWDLSSEDGSIVLNGLQVKVILNVAKPYVSHWWPEYIIKIFNIHGQGSKKKRKWNLTEDKYSSLPSLLVDMLLMKLDYSKVLFQNPVFQKIQQDRLQMKLEQDDGGKELNSKSNIPLCGKYSEVQADFHRWGPAICATFKGPEKVREKFAKSIETELKSSLCFHRKSVNVLTIIVEQKAPRAPMKKNKKTLKKPEKWTLARSGSNNK